MWAFPARVLCAPRWLVCPRTVSYTHLDVYKRQLYSYLGVEQARGLLSWSFSAQRIYKSARDAGYHYDRNAPQILPMTLIVGHEGKILFTHSRCV